jgi:hypothetical protein
MTRSDQRLASKAFSLVLVLALAFPVSIFASEKRIRSNNATVHFRGAAYKGAMFYVDGDLLVLKEKKSGNLLGIAFPEVESVSIKKSKAVSGMLVGLGIGIVLATLLIASITNDPENGRTGIFLVPMVTVAAVVAGVLFAVFTSATGALIGLLAGKKNFRLANMSPTKKEAALVKLKKYAVFQALPDELRAKVVMVAK